MRIQFSGTYKSLTSFEVALSQLSVITGPNGSGKTHFLELVQSAFGKNRKSISCDLSVTEKEVLFLPSEWRQLTDSDSVPTSQMFERGHNLLGEFREYRKGRRKSFLASEFERFAEKLGKPIDEITDEEFSDGFDPNTPSSGNEVFNQTITSTFLDYRHRQLLAIEKSMTLDEPPPWEVLRKIIQSASLPFEITAPTGIGSRGKYRFRFMHKVSNAEVTTDNWRSKISNAIEGP